MRGRTVVALAATDERAKRLVGFAEMGVVRFHAAFGRDTGRYAVFEFDNPSTVARVRGALRNAGFAVSPPLPSATLTAVPQQDASPTSPDGSAVTVVRRETVGSGEPRDEASFVPHELGHRWYAEA